jgi:hypothetical protein
MSLVIYFRDHDESIDLDGGIVRGHSALDHRNRILAAPLPVEYDYYYGNSSARVAREARVGDSVYAYLADYHGVVAKGVVVRPGRPVANKPRRVGVIRVCWTDRIPTIPGDTVKRATGLRPEQWVGYARGGLIPLPPGLTMEGDGRRAAAPISPDRRARMADRAARRASEYRRGAS